MALQRLIEVLKDIEVNGIEINYNNETLKIYFLIGQVLGDNLGLNEILGYSQSFNNCSYCRICMRNKKNCQKDATEIEETIRDRTNYLQEIEMQNENSAIKENSVWNVLNTFHVTDNKACDVMHDIYLGVAKYNLSKVLNYFIFEKKLFTLEAFNFKKQMFDYGPLLVGNNSPPLTKIQIQKESSN